MPTNLRWPTFASPSQALPHTSKHSLSLTACWSAAIRASSARASLPKRPGSLPAAGITPIVIPDAAPTPAIAYAVRALKTSGAINFTASHNPPEYNGIKFSTHDGAPALPEVTKQIEAAINALNPADPVIPKREAPEEGFETADVKPGFLHRLGELVDLKTIASFPHQGRLRSLLGSRPRLQLPHPARSRRRS